jgi:N-formylglutamate amidohydrolase
VKPFAEPPIWSGAEGESPLIAVAVHGGHALRSEIARLTVLDEATRLREEDPHTDEWARLAPTRLVACRSRFELDLNRPREASMYTSADDAWGLEPWRRPPSDDVIDRSRAGYDAFYTTLEAMLRRAEARFGRFVVYDLHSYNHRRNGPEAPPDDPAANPDINVGTGALDREAWAPVVERFMDDMGRTPVLGRRLDVRENVRFRGGHLSTWVADRFPHTGGALAIEVKKFFMDEHTGAADPTAISAVGDALAATAPGVLEALGP